MSYVSLNINNIEKKHIIICYKIEFASISLPKVQKSDIKEKRFCRIENF